MSDTESITITSIHDDEVFETELDNNTTTQGLLLEKMLKATNYVVTNGALYLNISKPHKKAMNESFIVPLKLYNYTFKIGMNFNREICDEDECENINCPGFVDENIFSITLEMGLRYNNQILIYESLSNKPEEWNNACFESVKAMINLYYPFRLCLCLWHLTFKNNILCHHCEFVNIKEFDCSICLDSNTKQRTCITECNHEFHIGCLRQIFVKDILYISEIPCHLCRSTVNRKVIN